MLNENELRATFVVPAFNEEPEILEQSLTSVMRQTEGAFECIVVDESTDPKSLEACKAICERDPRFRHVHPSERIGLAASLNLAISMAKAPLIARFDADDICLPTRLEKQLAYLDEHPEVGVVGAGLEVFDDNRPIVAIRHYPTTPKNISRSFQTMTALAHPTVIIRKSILDRHGGYDPSFRFAEDLDLWLRLLNKGVVFANLDEVLVRYRQASIVRNPKHWKFNLRARLRNFSRSNQPLQSFGILAIALWAYLPNAFQEWVFHRLILSKHRQNRDRG